MIVPTRMDVIETTPISTTSNNLFNIRLFRLGNSDAGLLMNWTMALAVIAVSRLWYYSEAKGKTIG